VRTPAPSDSDEVRAAVRRLGRALGVVGLLNVQLALAAGELYVLEVNPRASRTVPFASKATGVNLVDAACRLARAPRSQAYGFQAQKLNGPVATTSRPPSFPSRASRGPTRSSGPRCARPER